MIEGQRSRRTVLEKAVGDTFGLRPKADLVTDPDTGMPLEAPSPPTGRLRIVEVHERTSLAYVLESPGPIGPGDQLEWIGLIHAQLDSRFR